jgi:perosamine synthetase
VRQTLLPYGHQQIDEDDIQAVTEVLRSNWVTTGPKVSEFEETFADFVGAREAVAVSSGTAALHAAVNAAGIGPGDEVILPPMTFVATANAVVFQGGTSVFVDVDPDTLLIDPEKTAAKVTPRTRAIIAVDYAGQPCDYDALRSICDRHDLILIADACHSPGGEYKGRKVGTLADLTAFSFHPVKHITTGEGGMVVTDNFDFATKMRRFRNHGIDADHHQRAREGSWYYEMMDLGYNYRMTDLQSALGLSQLRKLPQWIERRRKIARCYDKAFSETPAIRPLRVRKHIRHAYHLYVIRMDFDGLCVSREEVFQALRTANVGVNVHYIPVHLHPFYRKNYATGSGLCPTAEAVYERIISLPIFPAMRDTDVTDVISALYECSNPGAAHGRSTKDWKREAYMVQGNQQMIQWMGNFGREYTDRNAFTLGERETLDREKYGVTTTEIMKGFFDGVDRSARILEVGSNIGHRLVCLQRMGFHNLYGIDVQRHAVELSKKSLQNVDIILGSAFDIPYKDGFFDVVLTSGLLIHIHPDDIAKVMNEIHRCTMTFIWGHEYWSKETTEVVYRGHKNRLWKADYGSLYLEQFDDLELIKEERLRYLDSDNIDSAFLLRKNA